MSQADDDAQAEADQLVDAAGEVHPLTGFAMGVLPGGDVRAVMQVEDADDAPATRTRARGWRPGPRPGRAATSPTGSRSSGPAPRAARWCSTCDPVEGSYVLSDLTSGPVLFATC